MQGVRFKRIWEGRLGRYQYFKGCLLGILVAIICLTIPLAAFEMAKTWENSNLTQALNFLNFIIFKIVITSAIVIPLGLYASLSIRRCHDIGYSGWLALLS